MRDVGSGDAGSRASRYLRHLVPGGLRRARRRLLTGKHVRAHGSPGPSRPGPNDLEGIRRIHVGCGPSHHPRDWWNVDIRAFKGVDEVLDATTTWPWRGIELVYAEHFLEHLPPDAAMRFLREAARSLRPGGVLRLATPSLEHVWVSHFHPVPGRPADAVIAETYQANRAFHGWGHQFLYSKPMLERLLRGSGFADLTYHEFGQSEVPELRGIERHPGWDVTEGWPSVWIVEAVRSVDELPEATALAEEIESEFARYVRAGH